MNEEVYVFPSIFPAPASEQENVVIALTDLGSEKPFMTLITRGIADLHLVGAGSSAQCFPFYVYDADGSNRRENITDWALAQFRARYGGGAAGGHGDPPLQNDREITKWDIFYYVYALLHHPVYRQRYADNLKRELPRIPFAPAFWAFADAGRKLADLHLNYETVEPYELEWITPPPVSYRVEKMRLINPHPASLSSSPLPEGPGVRVSYKTYDSLVVNPTLTLAGIPPEAYEYRLGNRSALEWVYQVSEDRRSGIISERLQRRRALHRQSGRACGTSERRDSADCARAGGAALCRNRPDVGTVFRPKEFPSGIAVHTPT